MMNNLSTKETGEIPETSTQLVYQLSANVSTSAPSESISAITSKETKFQNVDSSEVTDTLNSLLNESPVKPLKETDKLNWHLVEEVKEVKPIILNEYHGQSSNATTELSGIKPHPKRRKLKASHIKSNTSDTSFAITVIGDDTQPTILTTTSGSTETAELSDSRTPPHSRRPKLKGIHTKSKIGDISSATNVTDVETNLSSKTSELTPYTNYFQMYLNIRKQIDKRRKNLFSVQPKPPSGFEGYLMNKRTYILDGNHKSRLLNTPTPPPTNLHEELKKLFVEQEKERQKLRVQHIVEKDKLVLSVEQEILRVHGRVARALTNQPLPFSVCSILKDDEIYNLMTSEQKEEKDEHLQSCYNGHTFMSWLQEVDDKWENITKSLILRHQIEAESLHAVQKMDWGCKLKKLRLCTHRSTEPNIDDEHVPMVLLNYDYNIFTT